MPKQKYATILRKIADLQAKADSMRDERRAAITAANEAIKQFDITPEELFGRQRRKKEAAPSAPAKKAASKKAASKRGRPQS